MFVRFAKRNKYSGTAFVIEAIYTANSKKVVPRKYKI